MSIPIVCACGKRLRASDSSRGKSFPCPACGSPLAVPAAPEADPDPVLSRVARLERANRRLSAILAAAAVALSLVSGGSLYVALGRPPGPVVVRGTVPRPAPAAAARGVPGTVEAEAFILKDKAGVVRGEWKIGIDASASLTLGDARGERSLVLLCSRGGEAGVFLYESGRLRASLGLVRSGPSLVLWDGGAKGASRPRAVVSVRDEGRAGFDAYGPDEGYSVGLSAAADGSASIGMTSAPGPLLRGPGESVPRFGVAVSPDSAVSMFLRSVLSGRGFFFGVDANGETSTYETDSAGRPAR